MKNILHQFLYNPLINECGWICISTHKTPEGAEQAKEKHRQDAHADWIDEFPTKELQEQNPFGHRENWRTDITILLD